METIDLEKLRAIAKVCDTQFKAVHFTLAKGEVSPLVELLFNDPTGKIDHDQALKLLQDRLEALPEEDNANEQRIFLQLLHNYVSHKQSKSLIRYHLGLGILLTLLGIGSVAIIPWAIYAFKLYLNHLTIQFGLDVPGGMAVFGFFPPLIIVLMLAVLVGFLVPLLSIATTAVLLGSGLYCLARSYHHAENSKKLAATVASSLSTRTLSELSNSDSDNQVDIEAKASPQTNRESERQGSRQLCDHDEERKMQAANFRQPALILNTTHNNANRGPDEADPLTTEHGEHHSFNPDVP